MTEIAVLGYGTVGSGVYEVLNTNRESIDKNADEKIRIKYDKIIAITTHSLLSKSRMSCYFY